MKLDDLKSSGGRQYYTVFLVRRLLFVLGLFFLHNFPKVQLSLYALLSLAVLGYIYVWKPFKNSHNLCQEVLNEFAFLILLGLFFIYEAVDGLSQRDQRTIGWVCLGIPVICVILHSLIQIPENFRSCCRGRHMFVQPDKDADTSKQF